MSQEEEVNIMQPNCKHEEVTWDDFVSLETDEKDRCTKYVIYGYCPTCHHRFRKFFASLKNSIFGRRTYVVEKTDFR